MESGLKGQRHGQFNIFDLAKINNAGNAAAKAGQSALMRRSLPPSNSIASSSVVTRM